jgi:hypothetical protein
MLHNLIMSCLYHTNCSTFIHSLDHVRKEPESQVQPKQAQVEETNADPDQSKPRCIQPMLIVFYFEYWLYVLSF